MLCRCPRWRPATWCGLILCVLATPVTAQQWDRFRGPNGAGISDARTVPTTWTAADYRWTVPLPGRGHSSPVIWGRRLFVTAADEPAGKRYLVCIDTDTGRIDWQRGFAFQSYKKHKNNSFASSSPCVDAQHVYVVWHARAGSSLLALDHQGNEKWRFDLGPYLHGQGGAASPIVHGDLVILAHDQRTPSFLLAVDRRTGKQVWRIPREGQRACYATPCVRLAGGRPEIVFTHCFEGVIGVHPSDGKINWHLDVFGRTPQRALGSPIVAGDLVIATSGAVGGDRQLVALRPGTSSVAEIYRTTRQAPHVPTPIAYRDWLFLWSDQGIVSCLELQTGKTVWQKRVGGNYFGSPICVDGKLYCVDTAGTCVVLTAGDRYELLARNALGHPSKATPAVSEGTLFIRTESHVFAIGQRSADGT